MYLPFVRIAGGVAEGVRLLNGILLIGMISCLTLTIYNFSEKKLWREPMILLSLMAPSMCLTGPYIYLPSMFLASVAMLCFSFDKIPAWVGFIFISAILYVLRPTCAGFILTFTVIYGVLHLHNKRKMLFLIGSAAMIIVCGAVLKNTAGGILYKTGVYKYKEINDSAMLWTLELGTRNEGAYTGQCTYSAFGIDEDEHDKIKNHFGQLSLRYYYDEIYDMESYEEITRLHTEIQNELKDRAKHLFFSADLFPHILYKSANFYGNVYLPYYCRVNLTALDKPELDLNRIFFTYHNVILLMFFITIIVGTVIEFIHRTRQSALRLSLIISALAVQWLMILITEVSKKYMFDFYIPMMLTMGLFLSSFTCKTVDRINIILPMFTLAAALDIFLMRQYISPQLSDMKVQLTIDSDTEICNIDFGHTINEPGWMLTDFYGKTSDLYNLQYAEVKFPKNTFNAFRIISPDGVERTFSAQPIEEP
ncbi:MAG: hypothetical protein J1G06_00830 [Oscillospiraceae bacterium]|nr:hypothetical protein [Oscillospiraceae bacterium]